MQKKKILAICDHPLSTSGVGVQARYLLFGLIATGKYTVRCFGGAVKHDDYSVVRVNDDFIIKPIDGFGTPELIRSTIASERPDALFIFTDPRFFQHIFNLEDEIHQICPITYWHVWDNDPYPAYNDWIYKSVDLFNCHSHLTYNLVAKEHPHKANFIPHAVPQDMFKPLPDADKLKFKKQLLGENHENFTLMWVNRNARRKKPNDVLESFAMARNIIAVRDGSPPKMSLIMHTNPQDNEGPNLLATAAMLGLQDNIVFSTNKLNFEEMNVLYNISDATINIACAEGFGLSTLESMQTGTPIIATKTGGLTRQVVDHRDGTENGIALEPAVRALVGSQQVPYIYEDHVSNKDAADAIVALYDMSPEDRTALGNKARAYVLSEFALEDTVRRWDESLSGVIEGFNYKRWTCKEL
jgi:glycosyltransferase involved in cell wall biosynthesis